MFEANENRSGILSTGLFAELPYTYFFYLMKVDGRPLVSLPTKTVLLKELDFTEEERIIYDAYHSKARKRINLLYYLSMTLNYFALG